MPLKKLEETDILIKHNIVKKSQRIDQLALYKAWPWTWPREDQEQIQQVTRWRAWTRDLRITTTTFRAQNHSATLPPGN